LGDLTRVYEAYPFEFDPIICYGDVKGNVYSNLGEESNDADSEPYPVNQAQVYTVEKDEGPFDVSGYALVDQDCGDMDPERLAGAYVELQAWTFDEDDGWDWAVADDTTTSSAGFYEFEDAVEVQDITDGDEDDAWEDGDVTKYRLKIYVEEPGNTVSYVSDDFVPVCEVSQDFTIWTNWFGDELNLYSGAWCETEQNKEDCLEATPAEKTDSTGWYRIEGLEEGKQWMRADKAGYFAACTEEVTIPCNDQVYWNPELRCQAVTFKVTVTAENTGLAVYGADVLLDFDLDQATECVDDEELEGVTLADGTATFEALQMKKDDLPAVDEDVSLTVSKEGYDPETVYPAELKFYTCPDEDVQTQGVTLCGHFSYYGKVSDGTDPHIGYTVQAEKVPTGEVIGAGVSDSNGNYAVEVSVDDGAGGFRLRAYAPNGVLVWQGPTGWTATLNDCGELYNYPITF
jgi:hypothetical protein